MKTLAEIEAEQRAWNPTAIIDGVEYGAGDPEYEEELQRWIDGAIAVEATGAVSQAADAMAAIFRNLSSAELRSELYPIRAGIRIALLEEGDLDAVREAIEAIEPVTQEEIDAKAALLALLPPAE